VFQRGYLTLARPRGVALQIHVSALVAAALLTFIQPGFALGFFVVLFAHELGHAVLASASRLSVDALRLHALGGECRYSGRTTPLKRSVVAWGGVLAQGFVLAGALSYARFFGWPRSSLGVHFLESLIGWNLLIAVMNLLPLPTLDGWQAWQLPRWLFHRPERVLVPQPPPPPRPNAPRVHRPRHTPQQPFAAHAGGGTSGPISTASVVYDSDIRLPAETEAYLKAVLERTRKKSQPKN
jgi:hypothetical protein